MTRSIADILDLTVNEYLWNGIDQDDRRREEYTCIAILEATAPNAELTYKTWVFYGQWA